jgi:hypothetical protein
LRQSTAAVFARAFIVVVAAFAVSCSSSTPTTPSAVTPSTFVMTWPGLAFPITGVGLTSPSSVVITLWNTGTTAVAVTSVADSNGDEFPFTTTCQVGGSLPASSTCNVSTKFKPSALGVRTATLTINANGASQALALTGTGASISPQISIAPAGDVAPNVFTLSGTGMTPSGTVELHTTFNPAGGGSLTVVPTTTLTADTSGNVSAAITTDVPGTYEHWFVDLTSGLSTNHVVHIVP